MHVQIQVSVRHVAFPFVVGVPGEVPFHRVEDLAVEIIEEDECFFPVALIHCMSIAVVHEKSGIACSPYPADIYPYVSAIGLGSLLYPVSAVLFITGRFIETGEPQIVEGLLHPGQEFHIHIDLITGKFHRGGILDNDLPAIIPIPVVPRIGGVFSFQSDAVIRTKTVFQPFYIRSVSKIIEPRAAGVIRFNLQVSCCQGIDVSAVTDEKVSNIYLSLGCPIIYGDPHNYRKKKK